ncbi:hypothetical protein WA026_015633 [Henosepilachna vigintioctopunctata]|uniref:Uncharacterized protein n=1 Tax=Henosepilachna vigintioctopunctata TaxID=420089 RepID=A0AAW1VEM9_9CUCU
MSKQSKLTVFFCPKRKCESGQPSSASKRVAVNSDNGAKKQCFVIETISGSYGCTTATATAPCGMVTAPSTSTTVRECRSFSPSALDCKGHVADVCNFVSRTLNDDDRLTVLNHPWIPPKN